MNTDYPWQAPYEVAILETDTAKLRERLAVAKGAIDARLQQLLSDHGGTPEERQAICDALAGLKVLQRELEAWTHATGSSKA